MRLRHPLVIAAIATAAVVVTVVTVHHFRVAAKWAEMTRMADRLQAELDGRDFRRPVLVGEGAPGNAWDDYLPALATLRQKRITEMDARIRAMAKRRRAHEPWRDERDALLSRHEPALRGMTRGARRLHARYPIAWREGYGQGFAPFFLARSLGTLGLLAAERELERGEHAAAVTRILDTLQFGRDLLEAPKPYSESDLVDVQGTGNPGFLAQLMQLPPAQLKRLAVGLQILDGSLALSSRRLDIQIVRGVRHAQGRFGTGAFCDSLAKWDLARFGFSERFIVADHFVRLAQHAKMLRPFGERPWKEHYGATQKHEVEVRRTGNPLTRAYARIPTFQSRRTAIARLRMLRMAVEHRLAGSVTPLKDPFGDVLGHEVVEGKLRLWSVSMQRPTTRYDVLELPAAPR